jgi:hypothetical protein
LTLVLLSAGPMCSGCMIVKDALERAKVAFTEKDIRMLTNDEIASTIVELRVCGWNEKLLFSAEGRPVLQAPIVLDGLGDALWASFLLQDGQTLRQEFIDSISH